MYRLGGAPPSKAADGVTLDSLLGTCFVRQGSEPQLPPCPELGAVFLIIPTATSGLNALSPVRMLLLREVAPLIQGHSAACF